MTLIVFLETACKAAELGETGPDNGLESQVGELLLSPPRPGCHLPVLSSASWLRVLRGQGRQASSCAVVRSSCFGSLGGLLGGR